MDQRIRPVDIYIFFSIDVKSASSFTFSQAKKWIENFRLSKPTLFLFFSIKSIKRKEGKNTRADFHKSTIFNRVRLAIPAHRPKLKDSQKKQLIVSCKKHTRL